jgi:predicted RNase H-like nuclease
MTVASTQIWFAGVDGCRDGWIAAFVQTSGKLVEPRVFSKFIDILHAPEKPSIIAVDIPIGLPDRGGRRAETVVRPLLGTLRGAIFPIPSRRAIFAQLSPFGDPNARYAAHQRACIVAAQTSSPSKRITIQAFGLFPKIRELDALLQSDGSLKDRIFETHPELAFRQLNGNQPLNERKKSAAGLVHRGQLLTNCGFSASIAEGSPPKGARYDDLLDALACAFVARRLAAGISRPHPELPEKDQLGFSMAIWV